MFNESGREVDRLGPQAAAARRRQKPPFSRWSRGRWGEGETERQFSYFPAIFHRSQGLTCLAPAPVREYVHLIPFLLFLSRPKSSFFCDFLPFPKKKPLELAHKTPNVPQMYPKWRRRHGLWLFSRPCLLLHSKIVIIIIYKESTLSLQGLFHVILRR